MIRTPALALAAVLLAPAVGAAQQVDGVIATGPAASLSAPMTTEQKIANILAGAKAEDDVAPPLLSGPRQVHGEVGAAVGSDGYRGAYVHTVVPIGETGAVALSYSQSQGGRGYGYGYGPDGYGRRDDNRSVGFAMDFDTSRREAASDCRPAFREGRQAVEPLWAGEILVRSACGPTRAD